MSGKSRGGGRRFGDPAKRRLLVGDLVGLVQPSGVADPSSLGGGMSGPGGPRDRAGVVLSTQDVVLLEGVDVATMDAVRGGRSDGQVVYMTLSGRVNKSTRQVAVGFMFGPDGAAAVVTELLALADRFGPELLTDVTDRLVVLSREGNVDLRFLRAAVDNAIEVAGS